MELVTPEKLLLTQEVLSVTAPGIEGYFGVMAGHAPLIAELDIGVLSVKDDNRENHYAVSGGFVQVYSNTMRVLADTAEPGDSIDVERAEAALRRAQERLQSGGPDIDFTRAEAALKRALTRLKVASMYHEGNTNR